MGSFLTERSTDVKSEISTVGCNWNVSSLAVTPLSESVEHVSAVSTVSTDYEYS